MNLNPVSNELIKQYSGRTHIKQQITWLSNQNIPFNTDTDGKPVVAEEVFFRFIGLTEDKEEKTEEPNWDAL